MIQITNPSSEKEFLKIIMERNGTEGVEDSLYKAQSLGRRKN